MAYSDLPIIESLTRSMHYSTRRNRVLAQNIANVDTPDYKARDLQTIKFPEKLRRAQHGNLSRTHPRHFASSAFQTPTPIQKLASTSEQTISGNTVNLEENLVKINQNAAEHDRAISLYRKYFRFVNTATGRGGQQ